MKAALQTNKQTRHTYIDMNFNNKFQEMTGGRTLSLPRRHDYVENGEVDEGFQKRPRSRNLHASGTFSLHGTLRRNASNGQFNTTLEDDVFEDSISAPNSAKPLLHEQKNQTQYFPHLYNISPYGMYLLGT